LSRDSRVRPPLWSWSVSEAIFNTLFSHQRERCFALSKHHLYCIAQLLSIPVVARADRKFRLQILKLSLSKGQSQRYHLKPPPIGYIYERSVKGTMLWVRPISRRSVKTCTDIIIWYSIGVGYRMVRTNLFYRRGGGCIVRFLCIILNYPPWKNWSKFCYNSPPRKRHTETIQALMSYLMCWRDGWS
jgi:hypothetical protein